MDKSPKFVEAFELHGIIFNENGNGQYKADCPFCGKESHFFANSENGKWDCKKCGLAGGIQAFLQNRFEYLESVTTADSLKPLANYRRIPSRILKDARIVCDDSEFYIPIFALDGRIHDLRRYNLKEIKKKLKTTSTRKAYLYNAPDLQKANSWPVYVCEGEWDAIALKYLFDKINYSAIVCAIPGAKTMTPEMAQLFYKREVFLCFDNDIDGEGGMLKAYELLKNVATTIKFINWPHNLKEGYDISDYVYEKALSVNDFQGGFSLLHSLFRDKARSDKAEKEETLSPEDIPTLEQVLDKYNDVFELNPYLVDAIQTALATALAIRLPGGDPAWVCLTGAASCGKTAILLSMADSQLCFFQSKVTATSLISGWRGTNNDPSIIPRINNKCLIIKDFTEILKMPENQKEDVISILRGAFDGSCERIFGQGVVRKYKSRFGILAGATKLLYAEENADTGERFLKIRIPSDGINRDKQEEKAMEMSILGDMKRKELSELVCKFLTQKFETTPQDLLLMIPQWFKERIRPLARICTHIRTKVQRHLGYERLRDEIVYDPEPEMANRFAIQLQKLALSLALIQKKLEIDEDIYFLIRRIAIDTIYSYKYVLLSYLIGGRKTVKELCGKTALSQSGVSLYFQDMRILNLVEVESHNGETYYKANREIKKLWYDGGLNIA